MTRVQKCLALMLLGAVIGLSGCISLGRNAPSGPLLCSEDWYQSVEDRLPSGDRQGHGPDIGSEEWKSVVEFRLGVRDDPQWPHPDSYAWCAAVEASLQDSG